MARTKFEKIDINQIKITNEVEGITVTGVDKDGNEVVVNVVEKLTSLMGKENISFKIYKKKPSTPKEKKPTYKYTCGCGKVIKSQDDKLNIKCVDCDQEFTKGE